MNRRAEALEDTRARILAASMELHDEKGVAATSMSDVADRAGVAVSTVLRHFPTVGDLVAFCGMHVWAEMKPPTPDTVATVYDGAQTFDERLERLVTEIDAFYSRSAPRLKKAAQDIDKVPELAAFLGAVSAGVNALIEEGLTDHPEKAKAVEVVAAIMQVDAWTRLDAVAQGDELRRIKLRLLRCAIHSIAAE